jgi:hypothetical protein
MIQPLMLLLAGVVIVRTVSLSAQMSYRRWDGHPWQFTALSLGHALLCAGAFGVALGAPAGGHALLLGLTLKVVFDRRRHERRGCR